MPVEGVPGGVALARVLAARAATRRARAVVRSEPVVTVTPLELRQAIERSIDSVERTLAGTGPLASDAATRVHGLLEECLILAGGLSLRDNGADKGACTVADQLVREISSAVGQACAVLTVPGTEERTTYATGVIGLRFPGPDIWALPIAAHELGHVVAHTLQVIPPDGGRRHNPLLGAFHADGSIPRQREELWCDFFATYVLGPAYPWALLTHLPSVDGPPGGELEDPATVLDTHPGAHVRIHMTFEALSLANAAAGRIHAPYTTAVGRLRSVSCPPVPERSRKLVHLLAGRFWSIMTDTLGTCPYSVPMAARWLAGHLASGEPLGADRGVRVLDVVAAAWKARVDAWDRGTDITRHVEGRAWDLCLRLART